MWIFQKVSLLCYSVIILTRLNSALGALTGLLKLLVVIESYNLYCVGGDVKHCTIQSYDFYIWVEELSNFTYTRRDNSESCMVVCSVKLRLGLSLGKFGGKKCVMQYTRFLHPNAGAKLASP